MSQSNVKLTIVTIRDLCTACFIVEGAVRQIMEKMAPILAEVDVEWNVHIDPAEAMKYPYLEMPSFPALFLNGEQVTAGTIPDRRELARWIEERRTLP